MKRRVRLLISGQVQGVGFRYWVKGRAMELGLAGWVRNLADGRVEAVFEGEEERVEQMVAKCRQGPALSRVDKLEEREEEMRAEDEFAILK